LLVGLGISGAMIWYAFRETPFRDVWAEITAMRVMPMIVSVVVATVPFVLRVPRWQHLLHREDGTRIGFGPMWHAVAIGFAANNVLPFRLGEVLRMGAITRLARVPFTSALASIAVERVIDALAAFGLFGVALLVVDLPADVPAADKAAWGGAIALLALALAVLAARWPALVLGPVRALVPDGRLKGAMLNIATRVVNGLGGLGDWRRAVPVGLWSLLVWLVNAAGFWVGFAAFGIEVPFTGALILQGMLLIGIALPNAPGYAGVFETAIWFTLTTFYGVASDTAMAYAIAYHVLTFVPITLLGAWSLVSSGISFRELREAGQ
jgi:uncharacterized membrane protein YbhN (UPF0104 family)